MVTLTETENSLALACLMSSMTKSTGCYIRSVGDCFGVSYVFCKHVTIYSMYPEEYTRCGLCELCTAGSVVWEGTWALQVRAHGHY